MYNLSYLIVILYSRMLYFKSSQFMVGYIIWANFFGGYLTILIFLSTFVFLGRNFFSFE